VEQIVFCRLAPLQAALYKVFLRSGTVYSVLNSTSQAAALSAITSLRKLCNHPALVHPGASVSLPSHYFILFTSLFALTLRGRVTRMDLQRLWIYSQMISMPTNTALHTAVLPPPPLSLRPPLSWCCMVASLITVAQVNWKPCLSYYRMLDKQLGTEWSLFPTTRKYPFFNTPQCFGSNAGQSIALL